MSSAVKPPVVVLSRVSKTYHAGMAGCTASVRVLWNLSLTVSPGEVIAIDGARGAGKTTVALCAAGLLRPDSGVVRWPGLPSRAGGTPARIAYVADRTPGNAFLTVREAIAYAVTVRNMRSSSRAADPQRILQLTSLESRANVRTALLGDPDRARLVVALSLVTTPRLMLVDGVMGGPDDESRHAFAKTLASVAASGVAVVWLARATSTYGPAVRYVLSRGQLTRTGSRDDPSGTSAARRDDDEPTIGDVRLDSARADNPPL